MQNQSGLKLLFIVNPISGGKDKHDWEASIREYFSQLPHSIAFYLLTGKPVDKESVNHHINSFNPDRLVAVGGDGTVKMVAELVKETDLPLAIIPAGSANGMATELGIPTDLLESLKLITDGEVKKIDLIQINDKEFCIHLSDMGLNAMTVKYFEQSKKRGKLGYAKAALRVLYEKQLMRVTIKLDEKEIKRKAFMVVIANAKKYGTGAIINPDGKVDDGIFEVVVVRKLNLVELFKMIVTHHPFDPNKIEVFKTKSLKLDTTRKSHFQVDGEYLGRTTHVEARILPRIVNIVLPSVEDMA